MQGDRGSSEREADAHEHRQRHRDEAGVNGYLARERQETDYTRNADVGGARENGKDRYGDEVGGSVETTRKMTLVAEKETTRTTDAETTGTNHGTMGVKRERERDSFAHSVKDAEPHTLVWIRALRLEHLKKHSHLSDPDGGELLLKICGRQPSRRDSRARFLAALVPKYRPRARLVLLFLLPRVLPG